MILSMTVFLSSANTTAIPFLQSTQCIQITIQQQFDIVQDKKGNIIRKEGNKFAIMSEDGNEYSAPVQAGYQVGDHIYHTDPVNRMVEITGHVN